MKASPDDQQRLLELQAHDTALDRLAMRRRTLPELAEIEKIDNRLAELHADIVRVETDVQDMAREQRKIENDVDVVRTRMTRDQQRLDSGQVGSPKELENLQHELQSLARRQGDLEDLVLEQMERRDEAEQELAALSTERDALLPERAAAEARRDAAHVEIEAAGNTERAARDALAPTLPEDLMAVYEKVRADHDGVGAAALHRGRCEGCHLSFSSVDLDRMRKTEPDEVLRCEECRRILVRTGE